MVSEVFDNATALFITDIENVKPNIQSLFSTVTTTFASTPKEAYSAFDETTTVVCAFDHLVTESFEEFQTDVLVRRPFCQFLAIKSGTTNEGLIGDYDVILNGPVKPNRLQEVIAQRVIYAIYSILLQEFYHLNTRVAGLSEIYGEDQTVPNHITTRIQDIRPQLQALQANLTESQLREIATIVEQHKAYVNQPSSDQEAAQSKYNPEACPECGTVWGEDHGNELGRGFEVIGAGVWKCTYCDEIIHDLHDSNQSIRTW
ncbi:hypothetical protein [Halobacterium hubeiense]|uniref:hypothetical protein n=1 Tax=Halobacterium hubeiense TaxID=1407499 RepID=UPI003C779934